VREQRDLGPRHRFAGLTLNELPKEDVLAFVLDGNDGSTYEAVTSLTRAAVTSRTHLSNIQPPIVLEELDECEDACKESPEFQQAPRNHYMR
jgi:primary-amine oxidase